MGALMRSMDWSKTPVGALESWSPVLRMMVRLLLSNRFPLLLWWGPHYCQLYNDPYRPVLGDKHPASMGQRASECFSEIWDVIGPLIQTPFNGGSATWMDDLQLEYIRYDRLEEAHFTVAYSPVPDETVSSGIGGVLATVHEITWQVVGQRRLSALRDLGSRSGEAKTAKEACFIAARTLGGYPEDVPFALFYLLDGDRKQAHLAGAAGTEMGRAESPLAITLSGKRSRDAIWPLAQTVRSEAMQIVEGLQGKLASVPPGPWSDPPRSAVVWPIRSNTEHQLAGLLVLGLSSRLQFDDRYRDFCELVTSQVATAIANARAHEEERKQAEALAEIDRAKTVFFNNVSHEFRTPLTLMLGPLEEELRENSSGRERLEIAHRNSLRLLKLVNTLLDFARIEAGRVEAVYEPLDLAAATVELASVFRSAIEKAGLRLVVDCPSLPDLVYVDREMWEKIVLNLLSNAFKFTFEGEIKVSLCVWRGRAELSVSDTGAGIPAAEQPHIFRRFHRVRGTRSRTHEGTGIGLSLVQELVKIHGGGIRLYSVEGQGSTFTVSIPTGHAHLPTERIGGRRSLMSTGLGVTPFVEEAMRWLPDSTSSPACHLSGELGLPNSSMTSRGRPQPARILFADDNADMREYIRRLFAEQFEVETVGDGQTALERILTNPPDLVLADVMMPHLDGFGLLKRLREDECTQTIPFIMLSARAGEEARVEGLSAGANDYLTKPFSARELVARVGTHLEVARLRRAVAAALEESEKRFRELADNAPVMMWITDDQGSVEFANRTYLEYFEVVLADVAGQRWREFVHPSDDELYSREFFASSAGGRPFHAECRVRRGDGEWRWVDSWAVPRRTESGRAPGMIGCSADVTERKRAEERIRELGAIVEASDDAIFGTALDGTITSWNKGAEKIYGYAENEVVGQPIFILVPIDRQHEASQNLIRLALGEAINNYETVRRRKDGENIHVSLTICPIRNWEGRIVGASAVARDITQSKRIDGALRQSEQRFAAFMDNLPGFAWMKDARGCYTYLNREMARLPPFQGDWLGKTDAELWPAELASIYQASDHQVIAGGGALQTIERYLIDGDERYTLVSKFPMLDPAGAAVLVGGVGIDITERKRLEREILAVSEREQARIGQDLHDDLCQRLAGIQLMGDVLQRDLLSKAKVEAEQAGMIAARIRDAIANTRNIARGLSPVALGSNSLMTALQELADNSAKLFRISCKFRCVGSVTVEDNTVATHLYRIAQEAVTNAVKHGGAKKILIRLAESEDKRILAITDDGRGLTETFLKNKGTGLQIMNYRAATIGASLEIGRAGKRGVYVSCSFSKQSGPKGS